MSRVIPGIIMAGGWLLLLFLGTAELFWAVVVGGGAVALHEYFRMTSGTLTRGRLFLTISFCLFPLFAAFFGKTDAVLAGTIVSLLAMVIVALQGYTAIENAFRYISCSGFASLYISLCMAHLVLIRFLPQGPFWLAMLVAIVAGSDTGAYYAGRAFGHRKLFPQISPKKTVAGGVGGMMAGVVTAEGINILFRGNVDSFLLVLAALMLVVIGIVGDLTESMIKRSVGVKDSGTILMGHGGLLDRIDSLLLTGPVLYYLLYFGVLQ
jgi:phosphatidate cytidylyltransferase